jgi:hypothetical protein
MTYPSDLCCPECQSDARVEPRHAPTCSLAVPASAPAPSEGEEPKYPRAVELPVVLLRRKRASVAIYVQRCERAGETTWSQKWRRVLDTYDAAIAALESR